MPKFRTPRYEVYVVGSNVVVASDLCRSDAEKIARRMTSKLTIVLPRKQAT